MKINIKDSAIDLGAILLLHTIVIVAKKRVERQAQKAIRENDLITQMSCSNQLEQFAKIQSLISEIAKEELNQVPPV